MHIAVAKNPHKMQSAVIGSQACNDIFPDLTLENLTRIDSLFYGCTALQNNFAGAHSIMANFAITHVVLRHTNILACGAKLSTWIFTHYALKRLEMRPFNGVIFFVIRKANSVHYDKNYGAMKINLAHAFILA